MFLIAYFKTRRNLYPIDEKSQGLQRILFEEIFANVECFGFKPFIRVCKLLNETEKMRKYSISVGHVLF